MNVNVSHHHHVLNAPHQTQSHLSTSKIFHFVGFTRTNTDYIRFKCNPILIFDSVTIARTHFLLCNPCNLIHIHAHPEHTHTKNSDIRSSWSAKARREYESWRRMWISVNNSSKHIEHGLKWSENNENWCSGRENVQVIRWNPIHLDDLHWPLATWILYPL